MSLNLLPSQAKFQMEKIRTILLTRKILLIFLVIWVVVVLLLISVEKLANWQLTNENNKYKKLVTDYLQLSNEIVVSQTIKFRAKLLGKVLLDRFEYADAFMVVGTVFDPSITVKNFELKENSFFNITVVANDAKMMTDIENRISEINSGKVPKIKSATIKSVSFLKSSLQWVVNLEVRFI